ncbi:hypothetical protein [Aquirufa ecclesiirivi]|uniref:Uncharacterized protein n=1 Tax=Aquirufa ecclesiirivi TaxID=2715124 RepID=A0ABT4JH09_9BACT|nr:hypothetical protein [Aquirufa ecclesiirivi]MCZ2475528.1 hypothetical protein [Aquirufa ecclesiirivi]
MKTNKTLSIQQGTSNSNSSNEKRQWVSPELNNWNQQNLEQAGGGGVDAFVEALS